MFLSVSGDMRRYLKHRRHLQGCSDGADVTSLTRWAIIVHQMDDIEPARGFVRTVDGAEVDFVIEDGDTLFAD